MTTPPRPPLPSALPTTKLNSSRACAQVVNRGNCNGHARARAFVVGIGRSRRQLDLPVVRHDPASVIFPRKLCNYHSSFDHFAVHKKKKNPGSPLVCLAISHARCRLPRKSLVSKQASKVSVYQSVTRPVARSPRMDTSPKFSPLQALSEQKILSWRHGSFILFSFVYRLINTSG